MGKIAYKVLESNMESPFQGFQFEMGILYKCDDFDESPENSCSKGFYATDSIEGCLYTTLGGKKQVYECEVGGRSVAVDRFKQRHENITIGGRLHKNKIRALAKKESKTQGYNIEESLFPVNPLVKSCQLQDNHKKLLKEWANVGASVWASVGASVGASVWANVGASVRASVGASVGNSVGNSVRASVGANVGASVWASVRANVGASASVWASVGVNVGASVRANVGAYISSLFPQLYNGENPYQSCINLWRAGFVPSFDGKIWRLHSGKNAEIVYEIKQKGV